ncbi:hypothetical protein THOM_1680, partial [Trachipleistophora hominis]
VFIRRRSEIDKSALSNQALIGNDRHKNILKIFNVIKMEMGGELRF